MEYVSMACPFCGGTEIHRSESGGCTCAYCLQPFDVTSGKLSEGYVKLESYNFVGAQAFFQSMIGVSDVGNEAKYGAFLAKNKIEENKQGGRINPVVYSYHPESFETDPEYMFLRALFAGDAAFGNKLSKIEAARSATLTPRYDCDAIVFTDDETDPVCEEFLKTLEGRGIKTAEFGSEFDLDAGTLRCAEAMYVFAADLDTVNKMVTSGIARKYALLENARMHKTGMGKKPIKLICKVTVPDILVDGVRDIVEISDTLNLAAEVRRLGSVLNKSGVRIAPARRTGENVISKPNYTRDRIRTAVAEIKNEQGDLDRIKRSLEHGAYDDALRQAEKMQRNGCRSSRLYWYAYMAMSHTKDISEFVNYADESAFSDAALEACDKALYSCATQEEAKPYVTALAKAAMRLIDRKRADFAARAIDTAFTYDVADDYIGDILDRLNAAKSSLTPADWFMLQSKALEKVNASTPEFLLQNTCRGIDYALELADYTRADEMIEGILDYFPGVAELYERKICCENKIKSYDRIFEIDYPRLGDNFAYYVASQKSNAYNVLKCAFDKFVAKAEKESFNKYANALDEILNLGQMPELLGGVTVFTLGDMCKVGELALKSGNFDFASAYFMDAIGRDKTCYEAYWGALKAELRCRNDRQLEECETIIDGEGASNYYGNAYNTAYAKGDMQFVERIDGVRRRQSNTEKRDGHVFRRDDFIIENCNVVKYNGSETEKVLVRGGAYRINAYAMRGCDCKSVIVDNGVTSIGDGAFAFSDIEQITLPPSLREIGSNPFCGCNNLKKIICGGDLKFTDGALYHKNRLIAYLPSAQQLSTSFTVARGTTEIGSKAFYNVKGLTEVNLGDCDTLDNCAFYGCDGLKIKGDPVNRAALTGEGVFGNGRLEGGRIVADRNRWGSMYGGGDNNMTDDEQARGGEPESRKVIDTHGKITTGILIKNGVALYAVGSNLYAANLDDAISGKTVTPANIPLLYPVSGTGVLWNEYLIQPTGRDRCSLEYISPNGKSEFQVKIGEVMTKPLCIMGDCLLVVAHSTVISVDLRRGKIIDKKMLPERIEAITCASGGKFITAGERRLYAITPDLSSIEVHALEGTINPKSKIHTAVRRGRIVSYRGIAYFFQLGESNTLLCGYDGKKLYVKPIPAGIVDEAQNQPVIYKNRLYCADRKSVSCAAVKPLGDDWNFEFVRAIAKSDDEAYTEIAVVGGTTYVDYLKNDLFLRALYKGNVISTERFNGGIYAGRI